MKVSHWQEQLALTLEPPAGRVVAALWTRAIAAGMKEQMLAMAFGALGDMAAECSCAALGKRLDGTCVTGQDGIAVLLQVILAVPTQNIGNPEHRAARD